MSPVKNKQYTILVGTTIIKVRASNSNEALNKAVDIWHKRKGLYLRYRPASHIVSVK